MIDQFAGASCSQTWAQHIANGISDHGDDFRFGPGTPIIAPFSGTLRNHARGEPAPFQALYIATIQSDANPSVSMLYMHLSQFAPEGHYNEGDTIGLSGGLFHALGSGAASGPHIHVASIINGVISPYTDAFSFFASSGSTLIGTFLMALTDAQQSDMYTWLSQIAGADVPNMVRDIAAGKINFPGAAYNAFSTLANQGNALLARTGPTIDSSAITAAVLAALPAHISVTIDPATIATAVDASLADNFAAIPGQVRAAIIK